MAYVEKDYSQQPESTKAKVLGWAFAVFVIVVLVAVWIVRNGLY